MKSLPIRYALVLFAMCNGLAWAEGIHGPEQPVAEHSLVRLEVDDPKGASWLVMPAERVDLAECDGGKRLLMAAPPGRYTVLAAVSADGRPTIMRLEVTIQPARGEQEPTPIPSPAPAPAPLPVPAPAPVPPTPGPGPAPAPVNKDSERSDLERAALAYARSVPEGLLEAAEAIRAGRIANVNQAVDLVATRREQARGAYGLALDASGSGVVDAAGRIVDPARYAEILGRAARAMGGVK